MISVTESWFLSFFEPSQWSEVQEKLESITRNESTSIVSPEGVHIPVSKQAMDDMADLLAAAMPKPEDEPPPAAESPEPL